MAQDLLHPPWVQASIGGKGVAGLGRHDVALKVPGSFRV